MWPGAGSAGAFNWNVLFTEGTLEGAAGFDSQYWRANVNPSDRYVLSLPGSTAYRLAPDASGFDNLFLAGDWVKNGLDFGCIESAVMGGFLASRALCGAPSVIVGAP